MREYVVSFMAPLAGRVLRDLGKDEYRQALGSADLVYHSQELHTAVLGLCSHARSASVRCFDGLHTTLWIVRSTALSAPKPLLAPACHSAAACSPAACSPPARVLLVEPCDVSALAVPPPRRHHASPRDTTRHHCLLCGSGLQAAA